MFWKNLEQGKIGHAKLLWIAYCPVIFKKEKIILKDSCEYVCGFAMSIG